MNLVAHIATRHLEATSHKKSVALMKFLSTVAKGLGSDVAKHIYVVGGAVRDFYIDRPIKDIDVVIDSVALSTRKKKDSEWFAKALEKRIPAMTNLTTNQYGVAIVTVKSSWILDGEDLEGEVIEIANARKESYGGAGGKGYKPHMVEPATIMEDLCRREFTYNCLLWSLADVANGPDKSKILDMTGCGLKDLDDGIMRCPSDPNKTFQDDPTRMLRAIKFAVRYDHKLSPDAEAAIKRNAPALRNAPQNAISNILIDTLLKDSKYKKSLVWMNKLGLLPVVADMIRQDKSFRSTMQNWVSNKKVLFMFDMMDVGLPLDAKVSFLSPAQQQRLREIALGMSEGEPEAFLKLLKQPGKGVDMRGLIQEFGLVKHEIALITEIARDVMLGSPAMAGSKKRLTDMVRKELSKRKTAAGKFKKKRQVPKSDGSGTTTIYEYGPRQIANRNKQKAERIEKLRSNVGALDKQVKRDISCDDERTCKTALAVALMNSTYERVGNDSSAQSGHFGVTGWQKRHVKFSGDTATLTYTGKSGVKHSKEIKDRSLVSALKKAVRGKKPGDAVLMCKDGWCVTSRAVNKYLDPFDITAKDIRGFHANQEMRERLKAIRNDGPDLPRLRKDRDKILKAEFKRALEGAATAVGHKSSTLRSQYLVPNLESSYMKDGTVISNYKQSSFDRIRIASAGLERFLSATKSKSEKEDEETEKLIRKSPKKKPPRRDLRIEQVREDDPDIEDLGQEGDRDLSLNYKRVARLWLRIAGDGDDTEWEKYIENAEFVNKETGGNQKVKFNSLGPDQQKEERAKWEKDNGKAEEGGESSETVEDDDGGMWAGYVEEDKEELKESLPSSEEEIETETVTVLQGGKPALDAWLKSLGEMSLREKVNMGAKWLDPQEYEKAFNDWQNGNLEKPGWMQKVEVEVEVGKKKEESGEDAGSSGGSKSDQEKADKKKENELEQKLDIEGKPPEEVSDAVMIAMFEKKKKEMDAKKGIGENAKSESSDKSTEEGSKETLSDGSKKKLFEDNFKPNLEDNLSELSAANSPLEGSEKGDAKAIKEFVDKGPNNAKEVNDSCGNKLKELYDKWDDGSLTDEDMQPDKNFDASHRNSKEVGEHMAQALFTQKKDKLDKEKGKYIENPVEDAEQEKEDERAREVVETALKENLKHAPLPDKEKKALAASIGKMDDESKERAGEAFSNKLRELSLSGNSSAAIEEGFDLLENSDRTVKPKMDADGKTSNAEEVGENMAQLAFAKAVATNPRFLGGSKIDSNSPTGEADLTARSKQSYNQVKDVKPEAREKMSKGISGDLAALKNEGKNDSPEASHLRAAKQGVRMAQVVNDEEVEGVSENLAGVIRNSDAGGVPGGAENFLMSTEDMRGPKGRQAIMNSFNTMDNQELKKALGEESPYSGLLDFADSDDTELASQEHRDAARETVERMAARDMTLMHGMVHSAFMASEQASDGFQDFDSALDAACPADDYPDDDAYKKCIEENWDIAEEKSLEATRKADQVLNDCNQQCKDRINGLVGSVQGGDEKAFKEQVKDMEVAQLGHVKDKIYEIRKIDKDNPDHGDPWLKILEEATAKKKPSLLDKFKFIWDRS